MSDSRSSRPYLESPRHPLVKELRRLLTKPAERRARRQWVVEGPRLIEDALRAGLVVRHLLVARRLAEAQDGDDVTAALIAEVERQGGRVSLCSDRIVSLLADTAHPQGVIALVEGELPALPPPDRLRPPILMLDGVQDPGNVGTILRSAAAAGVGAVVLDAGCADLSHPKVIRASAGAVFRVPAARLTEPRALPTLARQLRGRGWQVLGLEAHGGVPYHTAALDGPIALVAGSEARGIALELAAECSGMLTIPLAGGVESLNVAAAVAVVLFEAARQRAGRG